ncbi:MAG: hypothetical protein ABW191_00675 [Aliihoeflea sp.]
MAEVALSWVATRPGVSSVLIGASRPEQVSALPAINPYFIFQLPSEFVFGIRSAKSWKTARRG